MDPGLGTFMAAAFIAQPFYLPQPDWKMNGRPQAGGPGKSLDYRSGPAAWAGWPRTENF